MDVKTAQERLLLALDILHPHVSLDALRLAEAIDDLIEARLERVSDSADGGA